MASGLQNKRRLKGVIFNFLISGASYVLMLLGLVLGFVPSSKVTRYGNINASQKPVNYWVTIVGLFMIGTVFLALALWALKRYRSNFGSYQ
ncbi:MAG: hypothetical protein IPI64_02035 [Chloracidobacterium sp.]|nr:hypothetical protein [Chloracidobacterium sp.]